MKARFKRLGRAAVCATVLLFAPSPAQAALLLPGTSVIPDLLNGPPGVVEASAIGLAFSTGPTGYTGSLTAAVIRNAGGTLDFYYQITNNASSVTSLSRNTNSFFALPLMTPFTTEVFYRNNDAGLGVFVPGSPGATPTSSDRGLEGLVVGFDFSPGAAAINPGETSRIVVIRTNALTFTTGFSSVLNGLPSTVTTFAPAAAAVPEPASLLLLSSAFTAAGYMARRRTKRRKAAST